MSNIYIANATTLSGYLLDSNNAVALLRYEKTARNFMAFLHLTASLDPAGMNVNSV